MAGSQRITVPCPTCGEVKVWVTSLSMLVRDDDTGHYIFRCPECREMVTREATAGSVRLLRSVRVAETRITGRSAPVLTEDDLIDFGRALESATDPWAELGASQPR